ncbi:MAG: Ig-like domain-containing protein, partial [Bacteroidales bacterium]|nr:Ig-like domain-containing protein [Bacteroidales bacterium]
MNKAYFTEMKFWFLFLLFFAVLRVSAQDNITLPSSDWEKVDNGDGTFTVKYKGNKYVRNVRVVVLSQTVTLSPETLTLEVGETEELTPEFYPDFENVDKRVTWESNKTSVATVDESGIVTAVSPGTATITVKTVVNEKTAETTVTVPYKYYVDPADGSDDNNGLTAATSYKTFDAALRNLTDADVDYTIVFNGEKTDNLSLNYNSAKSLTVCGSGSGTDYLNTTVTPSNNSIIFENIKVKQLNGGAVLGDGAVVENVTTANNLTVRGSAKAGNVTLKNDAKIIIAGELSAETVAVITPSNYNNQVIALADGVTDTKLAWERGRFMVTPSGGTYYYVQEGGKLLASLVINEENDAAHPYILTTDPRRTSVFSPEVYVTENVSTTTDKSFYFTFRNLRREPPASWNASLGFNNYNANTTFTYNITLEGTNSIKANGWPGIYVCSRNNVGTAGSIKFVFDAIGVSTLTFVDIMPYANDFEVRGPMTGTLTFELAPGCTFTGTVGGDTYSDITAFFNAARSHKGGSGSTMK